MKVLIHIGYPKCLSTTLQREIFDQSPDLCFGGVGVGDNISYRSEGLEFIFESLLKYSSESYFERNLGEARREIASLREEAEGRPLVFSSEHLGYGFTPQEVDVSEKLRRVRRLFDDFELELLLVLRDPRKLLVSLYKEYVRTGYGGDLSTFVTWFYRFRDRSGYEQFLFEDFIDRLPQLVPGAGVNVCLFEDMVKAGVTEEMNRLLRRVLGVRVYLGAEAAARNASLTDEETARLLAVNREQRRGIWQGTLKGFEEHRNRRLVWRQDPKVDERDVFEDVLAKRKALASLDDAAPVAGALELGEEAAGYWNSMMRDFLESYRIVRKRFGAGNTETALEGDQN